MRFVIALSILAASVFVQAEPLLSSEVIQKVKQELKSKSHVATESIDIAFDFYDKNRQSVSSQLQDSSCLEQKGYKIRNQDPKQKKADLYKGIMNESCVCIADFTKPKTEMRGMCVFLKKTGVESVETFPVAHGSGSEEKDGKPITFTNKLTPTGTTLSGLHLTGIKTTLFGGKEKHVGPYTSTGLSLYGLESSNWTAAAVGKVTHGAPYVTDKPIAVGHSLGCPAMPMETAKKILPRCQGQALWLNYTLDDVSRASKSFRSCK